MDMRTVTLENGWTGVVTNKPTKADGAGMSGFAAELNRVSDAAKQAETSGDAERPASLGAGAPPRFIEGPGYRFANPAFDAWLEEMAPAFEAQAAERLAGLPTVHTRLDDAQIQELARKYGGGRLSQNQYDDLLDELVHRGVLTRGEIEYMGYRGVTVTPPGCDSWCYKSDEYGNPLEDINGNPLDWAKKLMGYLPQDLSVFGLFYHEQVHRDAFDALQDTLERMNAY